MSSYSINALIFPKFTRKSIINHRHQKQQQHLQRLIDDFLKIQNVFKRSYIVYFAFFLKSTRSALEMSPSFICLIQSFFF